MYTGTHSIRLWPLAPCARWAMRRSFLMQRGRAPSARLQEAAAAHPVGPPAGQIPCFTLRWLRQESLCANIKGLFDSVIRVQNATHKPLLPSSAGSACAVHRSLRLRTWRSWYTVPSPRRHCSCAAAGEREESRVRAWAVLPRSTAVLTQDRSVRPLEPGSCGSGISGPVWEHHSPQGWSHMQTHCPQELPHTLPLFPAAEQM